VIEPGTEAPDFTLPDLDGMSRRLHDLKGQAVLLVFWTTW
jgi:peroxiredoxin